MVLMTCFENISCEIVALSMNVPNQSAMQRKKALPVTVQGFTRIFARYIENDPIISD